MSGKSKKPAAPARRYASSVDVARLAGVSQSAVSRAFTEGRSVSEKTRKRVLKAAAQLGYRPSVIPRIMLTNRSSLIAIASGGLYNPFYADAIDLFAKEIQARKASLMLFRVGPGEYIDAIIPLICGYRVDGIISALSILSEEAAALCAKMNVPVVLFNGRVRNDWVSSVYSDNVGGGREIAELFMARGVERFGFISGGTESLAGQERFAGYLGRLGEKGIRDVAVAEGQYRYEGGYRACLELLGRKTRPQAIFCANDLMAIGALEAARAEGGLRVPEDLLIAGFDDIAQAAWPSIDLTTVRIDASRMVKEALSILDRRIAGDSGADSVAVRLVPVKLIERGSTARAGKF